MVSFFPQPYPDEILYSVIAPYHIRSGNTSPKITLQELPLFCHFPDRMNRIKEK